MVKVEQIPGKGRGIIAARVIPQNTVIENAPAVALPSEQLEGIRETAIWQYCFVRPTEYNTRKNCARGYLVFGLSSLTNHSDHPNAKVEWYEDSAGFRAELIALRDIQPGEEVTMYYTNINDYPEDTFFNGIDRTI
ncbi:MAG: SET domain-containing protein-lysine N-methyltransferase [Candidatus Electrothrix sp. AW2]|jgi:hypothetical protein|nr:SET domain-containing protein-lysine N-methyltransferase [Candidatus Electrothrix gigas]MCI5136305.1 SET domain-containing protein-lysine N-methyltransferase [Candidatus Electrothrix gigas]